MSLQDIQKTVHEWVDQYKIGYWEPHQIYARLGEEVGEVGREINHLFGPKKKKSSEDKGDLCEEIGDVFFTLCCLANSLEMDLDEGFKKVMAKHYQRDKDRFERK